jgi:hypothetical protein
MGFKGKKEKTLCIILLFSRFGPPKHVNVRIHTRSRRRARRRRRTAKVFLYSYPLQASYPCWIRLTGAT